MTTATVQLWLNTLNLFLFCFTLGNNTQLKYSNWLNTWERNINDWTHNTTNTQKLTVSWKIIISTIL